MLYYLNILWVINIHSQCKRNIHFLTLTCALVLVTYHVYVITLNVISVAYITINKEVTEVYKKPKQLKHCQSMHRCLGLESFSTKRNGFFVSRPTASETLTKKLIKFGVSRVFAGLQLLHEQTVFTLEDSCKQCLLALNFNKANINLIKWSRKQAQRQKCQTSVATIQHKVSVNLHCSTVQRRKILLSFSMWIFFIAPMCKSKEPVFL